MKPTLILTVGLPRSGKSYWARTQGVPIVNPDSIRLALHGQRFQELAEPFVWAIAKVMARALFLAGHEKVIIDATNTTKARRDFWQSFDWNVSYHVISTSKETCMRRALDEFDSDLIPVIERMAAQYEPVDHEQ